MDRDEVGPEVIPISSARLHAWLLLAALLFSTTLPRAFVVCVSADDHVSLEAAFEGDPCELQFIFGARNDASAPAPSCTDIPAIQLSALHGAEPSIVVARPPVPEPFALLPVAFRSGRSDPGDGAVSHATTPVPPLPALRALRTTVLRL